MIFAYFGHGVTYQATLHGVGSDGELMEFELKMQNLINKNKNNTTITSMCLFNCCRENLEAAGGGQTLGGTSNSGGQEVISKQNFKIYTCDASRTTFAASDVSNLLTKQWGELVQSKGKSGFMVLDGDNLDLSALVDSHGLQESGKIYRPVVLYNPSAVAEEAPKKVSTAPVKAAAPGGVEDIGDGYTYKGTRNSNGKMHGKGVYTYPSGTVYDGEFDNGWFKGHGVLKSNNGSVYTG